MSKIYEVTIWLVGSSPEDAAGSMPFDSDDSARDYAEDNGRLNIYEVTATYSFDQLEDIASA